MPLFTTEQVPMQLAEATMKIVKDDKGVEHRMARCVLVLEPFGEAPARDVGEDIVGHLFTDEGMIRPEMDSVKLKLRLSLQDVVVAEVPDQAKATVRLREVKVVNLTVAHKIDEKNETHHLRASFLVLFSLAERSARDFLCRLYGHSLLWTFADEQEDLPLDGAAIGREVAKGLAKQSKGVHLESVTDARGKVTRFDKEGNPS